VRKSIGLGLELPPLRLGSVSAFFRFDFFLILLPQRVALGSQIVCAVSDGLENLIHNIKRQNTIQIAFERTGHHSEYVLIKKMNGVALVIFSARDFVRQLDLLPLSFEFRKLDREKF